MLKPNRYGRDIQAHKRRVQFPVAYQAEGSSFEIITPFPAAGDKYVSVFITVQNGKYIVTDGGWISDGVYNIGADAPELSKIFDRALKYFIADFSILRTMAPSNRMIYFKSTPDARFIPNLVFEVANFVSIVSSMALVPFKDEIGFTPAPAGI